MAVVEWVKFAVPYTTSTSVATVVQRTINTTAEHVIIHNTLIQGRPEIYARSTSGYAILKGNTYINKAPNIYESMVKLYSNNIEISTTYTVNGAYEFKNLNPLLTYEVKATPVHDTYYPKIITDISVFDNDECYDLKMFCFYNAFYHASTDYQLSTQVVDNKSEQLFYDVSPKYDGLAIDNTGTITFNMLAGDYTFTVSCTDNLLNKTASFVINLAIR